MLIGYVPTAALASASRQPQPLPDAHDRCANTAYWVAVKAERSIIPRKTSGALHSAARRARQRAPAHLREPPPPSQASAGKPPLYLVPILRRHRRSSRRPTARTPRPTSPRAARGRSGLD